MCLIKARIAKWNKIWPTCFQMYLAPVQVVAVVGGCAGAEMPQRVLPWLSRCPDVQMSLDRDQSVSIAREHLWIA